MEKFKARQDRALIKEKIKQFYNLNNNFPSFMKIIYKCIFFKLSQIFVTTLSKIWIGINLFFQFYVNYSILILTDLNIFLLHINIYIVIWIHYFNTIGSICWKWHPIMEQRTWDLQRYQDKFHLLGWRSGILALWGQLHFLNLLGDMHRYFHWTTVQSDYDLTGATLFHTMKFDSYYLERNIVPYCLWQNGNGFLAVVPTQLVK